MSQNPSKFVWHELMTSNPQAAEIFYKSVMGWSTETAVMEGGPYTLFSVSSTHIGGLMAIPPEACAMGAPPSWVGYIGVSDVDDKTVAVKAAGGKEIKAPADIPGVGRFSVVSDPQGAVFMLFQDSGQPEQKPVAPGTPGHVGWNELHAGDGPTAFTFYSSQFGWTKGEAMDMGALGVYQLFGSADHSFGGMMTKMPESPQPFWLFYFNVEALDPAIERVTQGGGKVINDPMQVPGDSWIVQCLDPQGAMFALLSSRR